MQNPFYRDFGRSGYSGYRKRRQNSWRKPSRSTPVAAQVSTIATCGSLIRYYLGRRKVPPLTVSEVDVDHACGIPLEAADLIAGGSRPYTPLWEPSFAPVGWPLVCCNPHRDTER
jgi:hypothetical protein